jgi:amino acid permease
MLHAAAGAAIASGGATSLLISFIIDGSKND